MCSVVGAVGYGVMADVAVGYSVTVVVSVGYGIFSV